MELGIKIAIIDNGFAYVGRVTEEDHYYIIIGCSNIRKTGTTKGFGQLAFGGPNKETLLDPCPPVMVPKGRLCHFIDCADLWKKHVK